MTVPPLSTADTRAQILELLSDMTTLASRLQDALVIEREALENQDLDAIESIVGNKSNLVENLEIMDRRREAVCNAWGFSSGDEGMQELIRWCDDNDQIKNRWQQLMSVVAQSNGLNLTNGAIIRIRQQQFEASLAVLRGTTPGSETYGRKGEDAHDFSRRSIATA